MASSTMAMKQVGFAAAQKNQLRASSSATLPARAVAVRKSVVCSASSSNTSNAVTAVALAAVVSSTAAFVAPEPANAEVSGLTPCAKSKPFKKRQKVPTRPCCFDAALHCAASRRRASQPAPPQASGLEGCPEASCVACAPQCVPDRAHARGGPGDCAQA
eukprot:scaffold1584_cov363-Prasinococcus_capsulatus_cf.AAC.5